jgi:hypothetical protein
MVRMNSEGDKLKTPAIPRVATVAALLAAVGAAHAQAPAPAPANIFIGGVQYSPDSSYTYAGLLRPMAGGTLGEGWYHKVIASWLTYRYDTTIGGRDMEIRAKAPGLEAGVGYGWKGEGYTFNLSGAIGYRHVRVEPVVPANEKTGSVWTFNPQLQGSVTLAPNVEASTIASYAFGQETAYAQARLAWKPSGTWFIGLQETYLKGQNYRINQHGIVFGRGLGNGYAIEASVGRSRPRNDDSTGYVALGLSRVF